MRKNFLLWSLTAATMMFFASCENENVPSGIENGKEATVSISIAETRSATENDPGSADERAINVLEAYTFSGNEPTGYAIATVSGASTAKKVDVKAITGNVKIVVVANSSIGEVDNFGELEDALTKFSFTKENSTIVPSKGFVMSAVVDDYLVDDVEKTLIVTVRRTVSKFAEPNFTKTVLDLSGVHEDRIKDLFEDFEGDYENFIFEYQNFVLANGLDNSLLINNASYSIETAWPTDRADWISDEGNDEGVLTYNGALTYLNSGFNSDGTYKASPNGAYSGSFGKKEVYVHENFPYVTTIGSKKGYYYKEVYCFIVKGKLWYGTDFVERYWRINLVRTTTGDDKNDLYRIFRNGYYKVSVDKITSIGYGTPKEAEEEEEIIPIDADLYITVDVEPWDIYFSNTSL